MRDEAAQLRDHGFVVLRDALDPVPLRAEVDAALADGVPDQGTHVVPAGAGTVSFRYVPMMCERTPVSLALLDGLLPVVARLVGRDVIPGRAKGTRYLVDTGWHRDGEHDLMAVGCIAYLEPLTAATGALRVVPGSHTDRGRPLPGADGDGTVAIETSPGDLIVFDEHLIHGSVGGRVRTQWRVDVLADPVTESELGAAREWFEQSIPDERNDPGYDAARYPSYGTHWRSLDRPWMARLAELGVLDLAGDPG